MQSAMAFSGVTFGTPRHALYPADSFIYPTQNSLAFSFVQNTLASSSTARCNKRNEKI